MVLVGLAILSLLLIMFVSSCDEGGEWQGNTPNKVFLSRITLNDYPETKEDGMPWDQNSPPDINMYIWDETGESVIEVVKTNTISRRGS